MSPQVQDTELPFNLEQYLSKLTLQPIIHGPLAPPMPPPEERSNMTPLALAPGGYRRLREMHNIHLDEEVASYFGNLPEYDGIICPDLRLTHTSKIRDNEFDSPYVVNNATNVISVLDKFLLHSTQILLQTLDQGMREWTFETIRRPRRSVEEFHSVDPIVLVRGTSDQDRFVRFVLVPLGPWEFAPKDFTEFTSLKRFDDTPVGAWKSRNWVNADKMWAYLYDMCLDLDCPYFAVTSHEQWSFGSFSRYYSNAWLTSPLSFDHRPVSIVELLTYWIHTSFGKPGTIVFPPVHSERYLGPEIMHQERRLHSKRFLNDALSGAECSRSSKRRRLDPARKYHGDGGDGAQLSMCTEGSVSSEVTATGPQQPMHVVERFKRPNRRFHKLRTPSKKRAKLRVVPRRSHSTESVLSSGPSIAPSSAEALPKEMVPRRKSAAVERWRDMVAIIQNEGPTDESSSSFATGQEGKWVNALVCDSITGCETGDQERIVDHTCSSCGPSSPTLSACSLSSEELRRWNQKEVEDFSHLVLDQWF